MSSYRRMLTALLGVALSSVLVVPAPAMAQQAPPKVLVNTRGGLALEGHDPVAFFTVGKPVRGQPDITEEYQTATYRFASAENRDRFAASPEKFAPQYGGYCAYGMAKGYTAPVEISTWQIVDGRLMLNYDAGVQRKFNEQQAAYVKQADSNWPQVREKRGVAASRTN